MGTKPLVLMVFLLLFWQVSWDFVKEEVMGFFKEFYEQNNFEFYFFGVDSRKKGC